MRRPFPTLVAAVVPHRIECNHHATLLACVSQVIVDLMVQLRRVVATYLRATPGGRFTARLRARLLSHGQLLLFVFDDAHGSAASPRPRMWLPSSAATSRGDLPVPGALTGRHDGVPAQRRALSSRQDGPPHPRGGRRTTGSGSRR